MIFFNVEDQRASRHREGLPQTAEASRKKVRTWKNLIFRHGPDKLREFPGFHDEKLIGDLLGQRSSRLNIQYRVIYEVEKQSVTVFVIEITPHVY
jgi:plasmid maintenance system killer protein/DNA-binding XRE family transcriptional regulator